MMENNLAISFISLGGLLLAGLAMQWLGQKTAIPRVTLLIFLGLIAGPSGFNLIGEVAQNAFPWISHLTLAMVGFLLGGKLHRRFLRRQGKFIISASLWITLLTWLTVAVAIGLFTQNWALAVLLAAVATATDPAAISDVITELKLSSKFENLLIGIVTLDDVWGLLLFSTSLVIANFFIDTNTQSVLIILWELVGSVGLGLIIGLPFAWISGRSSDGEPLLVEALGAVILCAGVAVFFELSYLLACIAMGVTVTNAARHHKRPFHSIEQIEWPFMMLFFILAGASLEIEKIGELGLLGGIYIAARIIGRLIGAWCFGVHQNWPTRRSLALGQSLLPQAGVAIGIALGASQIFPDLAESLLTCALGATILFELMGPPLAKRNIIQQANYENDAKNEINI
ncbi:cation:proton antiporter [Aurantivibrio infirmus]